MGDVLGLAEPPERDRRDERLGLRALPADSTARYISVATGPVRHRH